MAFKVASKKAQEALRRILPSFLSDYKEELTKQQKLDCLAAAYTKILSDNAILKMATNRQQRFEYAENIKSAAALYKEMTILKNELTLEEKEKRRIAHEKMIAEHQAKSAIIRKEKAKLQAYRDNICLSVIKEMNLISRETWIEIGAETERRLERLK